MTTRTDALLEKAPQFPVSGGACVTIFDSSFKNVLIIQTAGRRTKHQNKALFYPYVTQTSTASLNKRCSGASVTGQEKTDQGFFCHCLMALASPGDLLLKV